jgi:hypothetical protein
VSHVAHRWISLRKEEEGSSGRGRSSDASRSQRAERRVGRRRVSLSAGHVRCSFVVVSVAECYKNEKRIDQACKQLTSQSTVLIKQSQAWITLIGQFTMALKVRCSSLVLFSVDCAR